MFRPILKIDAKTKREIPFCDVCLQEIDSSKGITCTIRGFSHPSCHLKETDSINRIAMAEINSIMTVG